MQLYSRLPSANNPGRKIEGQRDTAEHLERETEKIIFSFLNASKGDVFVRQSHISVMWRTPPPSLSAQFFSLPHICSAYKISLFLACKAEEPISVSVLYEGCISGDFIIFIARCLFQYWIIKTFYAVIFDSAWDFFKLSIKLNVSFSLSIREERCINITKSLKSD